VIELGYVNYQLPITNYRLQPGAWGYFVFLWGEAGENPAGEEKQKGR
jgi:hypothetical protein